MDEPQYTVTDDKTNTTYNSAQIRTNLSTPHTS